MKRNDRRAFTLVEMLLATTISALVMGAVLMILANLSRDRWRLNRAQAVVSTQPLLEQLRWDLANATTMAQSPDGQRLTLVGNGGIDPDTLTPSGRLAHVVYRADNGALVREQYYLDDPVRPQQWRETVAGAFRELTVIPRGIAMPIASDQVMTFRLPQRVQLRVQWAGVQIDQELWIK